MNEVIAQEASIEGRGPLLHDNIRSRVFSYLYHRDIKLMEMTCKSLQLATRSHCRPKSYGGDVIFNGTILRFIDGNVHVESDGKQPWFCGTGGVMGFNCIGNHRTEVKLVASTDFDQCGYRMTLGFTRPPDHMKDFRVRVETDDGFEVEINEDDVRFHNLQSAQEIASGFSDFRIPRSCRSPSEYSNKVHRFFANVQICRPVQLHGMGRNSNLNGQRCPATSILHALKWVGEDEQCVETHILPSPSCFFHSEVVRGLPPPANITFILSRTEVGALRIHAKMPHYIGPNEHIIVHRYAEVIDDVSGPYTWFVELGPTRNENGSISVS